MDGAVAIPRYVEVAAMNLLELSQGPEGWSDLMFKNPFRRRVETRASLHRFSS